MIECIVKWEIVGIYMFYIAQVIGHYIKKESSSFMQSFVTLVFLALKAGQGVRRPESKTDLMSSPLLH